MSNQEFITWLKGFTEGVHDFNITPKQWDLLKERLAEVVDEEKVGTPIGVGGWGTPSGTDHDPIQRYPWGGQVVWAGTPIDCLRTSGYIAPVDQQIPSSTITTGSTSTAVYSFPGTTVTYTTSTGSAWSYTTTNSTDKTLLND